MKVRTARPEPKPWQDYDYLSPETRLGNILWYAALVAFVVLLWGGVIYMAIALWTVA